MSVDADLATLRKVLEDEGYRIDPDWGHIFQAFDRVEAELSRLREQRDALEAGRMDLIDRAATAEARCARLQQAITDALNEKKLSTALQILTEALAGPGSEQGSLTESGSAGLPDTPADSRERQIESALEWAAQRREFADSRRCQCPVGSYDRGNALVNVARAAEHILAHGKLGKQSERRLREALAALGKEQS